MICKQASDNSNLASLLNFPLQFVAMTRVVTGLLLGLTMFASTEIWTRESIHHCQLVRFNWKSPEKLFPWLYKWIWLIWRPLHGSIISVVAAICNANLCYRHFCFEKIVLNIFLCLGPACPLRSCHVCSHACKRHNKCPAVPAQVYFAAWNML